MVDKIIPIREPCDVQNGIACHDFMKPEYFGICKGRVRIDIGKEEYSHQCPWNGWSLTLTKTGLNNIHNLTAEERYLDISTRAKEDKLNGMSSTKTVS